MYRLPGTRADPRRDDWDGNLPTIYPPLDCSSGPTLGTILHILATLQPKMTTQLFAVNDGYEMSAQHQSRRNGESSRRTRGPGWEPRW